MIRGIEVDIRDRKQHRPKSRPQPRHPQPPAQQHIEREKANAVEEHDGVLERQVHVSGKQAKGGVGDREQKRRFARAQYSLAWIEERWRAERSMSGEAHSPVFQERQDEAAIAQVAGNECEMRSEKFSEEKKQHAKAKKRRRHKP